MYTIKQWAERLDMTPAEARSFLVVSAFSGGGAYTVRANDGKWWHFAHPYGKSREGLKYLLRRIRAAHLRPTVRAKMEATLRAYLVEHWIERTYPDSFTPDLRWWRTLEQPAGIPSSY